jgi:hypothetical protein
LCETDEQTFYKEVAKRKRDIKYLRKVLNDEPILDAVGSEPIMFGEDKPDYFTWQG